MYVLVRGGDVMLTGLHDIPKLKNHELTLDNDFNQHHGLKQFMESMST